MSTLEPFTAWLEEQDRSPRTVRAYSLALRDFAAWFRHTTGQEVAPERITPLDVKAYRQHLTAVRRLKPATINNYLAGIRAYARWAKQTGRAEHDPTNGIKGVREAARAPRWLARSEQYALLRVVKERVQLGDLRAKGDRAHPGATWLSSRSCSTPVYACLKPPRCTSTTSRSVIGVARCWCAKARDTKLGACR